MTEKKIYDPDKPPVEDGQWLEWAEATAAEHQRRRFEEEPFSGTFYSAEDFIELLQAGYFDPPTPGIPPDIDDYDEFIKRRPS